MQKNVTPLFTTPQREVTSPLKLWRGFIKDLEIQASIGIYEEEFTKLQKVIVNVEYDYEAAVPHETTDDNQVVCYFHLCKKIEELAQESHIYFVENLAEQITELCLQDSRVQQVKVHVEKFPEYLNAKSLGVEIIRNR